MSRQLALGLAPLFLAGHLFAETVSHEPPALYRQRLAPWLTPTDTALAHRQAFADTDTPGVVLLYETVRTVDATGRSLLAIHRLDLVRTEAGVKPASEELQSYRKNSQKIHLVLAQTIQPDGRRQPVAANGAFLQSPQRDADAA